MQRESGAVGIGAHLTVVVVLVVMVEAMAAMLVVAMMPMVVLVVVRVAVSSVASGRVVSAVSRGRVSSVGAPRGVVTCHLTCPASWWPCRSGDARHHVDGHAVQKAASSARRTVLAVHHGKAQVGVLVVSVIGDLPRVLIGWVGGCGGLPPEWMTGRRCRRRWVGARRKDALATFDPCSHGCRAQHGDVNADDHG